MRSRKRKSKSRNKAASKKVALSYFSLRDMLDVLVIVVLLSAVVYFSHQFKNYHNRFSSWPTIEYVEVEGKLHPSNQELFKEIVSAHVQGGFFRVPIEDLEQNLSKLPWVYQATVQRSWPDQLMIHVQAQQPIARWGERSLMNAYGEVFNPDSIQEYAYLPMLYGEQGRSEELAHVFEASMQKLQPLGLKLRALYEDERQSKYLVMSNGLILALGSGGAVEKISRFITAHEKYLSSQLSEVQKIDLRYSNGLAVEWKNPQLAQNFNWKPH